jgi:hypothetical protein
VCRVNPEGVQIRALLGRAKHVPDFMKVCPQGFLCDVKTLAIFFKKILYWVSDGYLPGITEKKQHQVFQKSEVLVS